MSGGTDLVRKRSKPISQYRRGQGKPRVSRSTLGWMALSKISRILSFTKLEDESVLEANSEPTMRSAFVYFNYLDYLTLKHCHLPDHTQPDLGKLLGYATLSTRITRLLCTDQANDINSEHLLAGSFPLIHNTK